jgi:uncharacterized protein (TIGR02598 family)
VKVRNQYAFSLVEVTLALGVAAISLLVIFTLLPIGLQTNQRSVEQTASADILSAVVADLRATPITTPRGNTTSSIQFGISIPAAGTQRTTTTLFFNSVGQFARSQQPNSRYRVTITFVSNGGEAKAATLADLQVTWPASAAIINAQGSAEMFAAFDRN